MWTATALAAALSMLPAQPGGGLDITNVRVTHGVSGATRKVDAYLPGDQLCLSFDVEGIKPDPQGRVKYAIGMEVLDGNSRSLFKQNPKESEATNSLGGTTMPAVATLDIGLDQPPGDHTLKVTITDPATKTTKTFNHKFTILPKAFGIVRVMGAGDPTGTVALPIVAQGQSVWVNFVTVGFGRSGGNPNLKVEMRVLDEDGKPTLSKPLTGEVTKFDDPKAQAIPMQFLITPNRAGKYTVELTVTDQVSKKSAKATYPLTVMAVK